MRYLSLFSGIEAATAAWHPLGWQCVGVSEIEPFPCSLLAQKYPHVPNLGDVTLIDETDIALLGRIDLIVFGSPCQDLSVAGKRKGLAGERSGLFHTAIDIIEWAREHCGLRWALWENVPGAFSSNAGRDFAVVVGELAGLEHVEVPRHGWGNEGCAVGQHGLVEWSTLDAQWFGVAQRRRRVFALADFGDWPGRQPILLEPYRLRGDSAPRREAGQEVAGCLSARTQGGGGLGTDFDVARGLQPVGLQRPGVTWPAEVAPTLNAAFGQKLGLEDQHIRGGGGMFVPGDPIAFNWNAQPDQMKFDAHTTAPLTCSQESAVAIQAGALRENPNAGPDGVGVQADIAYTLEARAEVQAMQFGMQVRRLTPMECERLQGFPDCYTNVTYRGKPAADGPRYKALGNSMAVPVMRWIGRQINMVGLFQ